MGQFLYHLGLSWPILFLWASLAHLILSCSLHCHELLLNFLGFPSPITISFTLSLLAFEPIPFTNPFLRAPSAYFCLFSTSYDSHGLITSFFGAPLSPFAFFGAFLLFCRPVGHYSCHSGIMVFFPNFANSSFFTPFHIVGILL